MAFISQSTGYIILLVFGLAMILITYFFARWKKYHTKEGFLVAGRNVRWWLGGPSIAASWIWAGALFVSVQLAYQKGLAGIFWFTLPNIIALGIFAFFGPKIREKFTNGFTLPQFIKYKLKDEKVHKLYLVPFFAGQIIAITFNVFAGAAVISLITGIPIVMIMPFLAIIALIYTLISGLEASIVTDFVQMILILIGVFVIVPLTVSAAGGFSSIIGGLQGIEGIKSIFNPAVAFSLGVVTSIGLISQTITDQQYWQRTFALKKSHISKAFIFGALLFAVVPIGLSMLGFLGANSALGIPLPDGTDPSLIGVITVTNLLPMSIALIFVIILLGGLSSTIDSGISATASLWATDVAKYSKQEKEILEKQSLGQSISTEEANSLNRLDNNVIWQSRLSMIGVTILALIIAYAAHFIAGFGVSQLFMISISVAASASVPTILSLYWDKLSAKGTFWGILIAIVGGMPLFIYANVIGNETLIAVASLFMVLVSTIFCLAMPKKTNVSSV